MKINPRLGSKLSDGRAHEADHRSWNRRDFMSQLGVAGIAASFCLGQQSVHAYGHHPLVHALSAENSDQVLVMIQLVGGNDGLNTVIPFRSDEYYRVRPNIAIPSNEALSLNTDFGLHPGLSGLDSVWGDGKLGVVHSVGYPDPNLSHFRSKDIWSSASESEEYLDTGWLGRHFNNEYPGFTESPTEYPLAVQLGQPSALLLQGPIGPMGMNIPSQTILERLSTGGKLYDEQDVPATGYGAQLAFSRLMANNSYQYAGTIFDAFSGSSNAIEYPDSNLAGHLASVARMIKGGLPTRLYVVSLGGFDTHYNQLTRQGNLMAELGGAMAAFQQDIASTGHSEKVLTMTFSEFGRRVEENASRGTDHGTAAPLFVMGDTVNGGMYGDFPDLLDVNSDGNLKHTTDFRSVYATVLERWLGADKASVDLIMGGDFDRVDFVEGTTVGVTNESIPAQSFVLRQNYPNPFSTETTVSFSLQREDTVRLTIYDLTGREVQVVTNRSFARGDHNLTVDAELFPSGTYIYRLETSQHTVSKQMTVVR